MQLLWLGLLLQLACSSAAINQRRQITPELLEGLMSADGLMPLMPWLFGIEEPASVMSDKTWILQPEIQKNATRKLVRWGPFSVPGIPKPDEEIEFTPGVQSMDPMGKIILATLAGGFCENCTVLAGKSYLTYADGTRADINSGIYLHHILTVDRSKPPPTFVDVCSLPSLYSENGTSEFVLPALNPFGMLFLGGGHDGSNVKYSIPNTKIQSGYHIKNNTFAMTADIVNYSNDRQEIYVTFDIEYLPGMVGADAVSTLLSVTGCSFRGFFDDEAVSNMTSTNFTLRQDGWILSARGHLHDGGEAMQLLHNEKFVCNSTATYGGKGGTVKKNGTEWQTITSMSECQEPLRVKKGDHISMKSFYNTIKHPLRESQGMKMEEMGMFSIAFVPST